MERRVLFAIVLAFLTLYLWQALFVKPQPKPAATAGSQATEPARPDPQAPAQPAEAAPAPPAREAGTLLVSDTSEQDIRVETRDVIAVFTNRGARLKSWRLKHYLDTGKQPVELVVADLAATQPLPFSIRVDDEAVTAALNGALYTLRSGTDLSGASTRATEVVFEYRDSAGLHAVKQFTLNPTSYEVGLRATVTNGDAPLVPTILWGPGLGDPDSSTGRYAVKPGGLLGPAGSKAQRLAASAVAKQAVYEGDFQYAGIEDHYFVAATIAPGRSKVSFRPVAVPGAAGATTPARELMAFEVNLGVHDRPFKVYIGPKDFDELKAAHGDLVKAIDFGMFDFIIVPLLRSLTWINGYVGNYGWAIIILTVLINGVMFPLRHKSVVSMRRMQEIQPEAKAIQDRYAKLKTTDPARQKMNQELMALYKERGVNPASGCIPMVLTFPVLFAFYSLLTTAIELRGAPFMLWIHDLSLPDPYYVTPILMGGSQLWQQWIAPATGVDPAQRKMMMFMPLVFTFIFVAAPSGTVLYWLVSNVWAIGQQYLTNYLIGPPTVRTVRPPAERRLKRAGVSRTEAAGPED